MQDSIFQSSNYLLRIVDCPLNKHKEYISLLKKMQIAQDLCNIFMDRAETPEQKFRFFTKS